MALIVEILKAGQIRPQTLAITGNAKLSLSPGDILNLPDTEIQTLRQGEDLVLVIPSDNPDRPERILVPGFFSADSFGMVQIGDKLDGNLITPQTQVTPTEAHNTFSANGESDDAQAEQGAERQSESERDDGSSIFQSLAFSDLPLTDTPGLFTGVDAASQADSAVALSELFQESNPTSLSAELLSASGRLSYGGISTDNNQFILLQAPEIAAPASGRWINSLNVAQDNYTLRGTAVEGFDVEITLQGASGALVRKVPAAAGGWDLALTANDIRTLGEGDVQISVIQRSAAGQALSQPSSLVLSIDTVPPTQPTVNFSSAVADGVITAADVAGSLLQLTGTGDAGSRMILTLLDSNGHSAMTETTVNAAGQWSLILTPTLSGLADGALEISVRSWDAAGNSIEAPSQSVSLWQNPPLAPTTVKLTAASDTALRDNITATTAPTFEGTAAPNTTVRVYRDINLDGLPHELEYVGTVTPDPVTGRFEFTAPTAAADGSYQYLFQTVDAVGNRSVDATPVRIEIDTLAVVPVLDVVSQDNRIGYDETLVPTVTFTGTGEAGSMIRLDLTQGNTVITYEARVQSNGVWQIPVISDTPDVANYPRSLRYGFGSGFNGAIEVQVSQTDIAGNTSNTVSQTVYLRTEPVPDITQLNILSGQDTGISASDGITHLSTLTLVGKGPANMMARLYLDTNHNGSIDAGDTLLTELSIDSAGNFSGAISLAGGDGAYSLLAVAYDDASGSQGNLNNIVSALQLTLDTTISKVLFDPVAGNDIINASEIVEGGVEISGRGEPGATVNLVLRAGSVEDTSYVNIPVDAQGLWRVKLNATTLQIFGNGSVTMLATQTDKAGNFSSLVDSDEKVFQIRTSVLAAPSGLTLDAADDSGAQNNDAITNHQNQLTLKGQASPGDIVHIFKDSNGDGIFDAGEALGQGTVASDGSFSVDVALSEGVHLVRALVEDAVGQRSAAGVAKSIAVDTTITLVSQLQATQDNVFNSSEAAANSAAVSGTGEPGALVTLEFMSGSSVAFTKTGSVSVIGGVWSVALSASELSLLGQGEQQVRVKQQDVAGNESGYAVLSFNIDTLPVGAPDSTSQSLAQAFNESDDRAWRDAGGSDAITWDEAYRAEQGVAVPNTLQIAVALATSVEVEDNLRLFWGNQLVQHTVTAQDMARGFVLVDVSGDVIAQQRLVGATVNITANYVDTAGNTGTQFTVMSGVNASLEGRPPSFVFSASDFFTYEAATNTYYTRFSSDSLFVVERQFRITGSAAANGSVILYNDVNLDGMASGSEILAQVDTDAFGIYVANLSLAQGSYNIRTVGVQAGAQAISSEVHHVVVNSTTPAAPVLQSTAIAGDNRVNAAERDAGVMISGTSLAHAKIQLQLINTTTGVRSSVFSDITADATGDWQGNISLLQWGTVGDGTIALRVSQVDRSGNFSAPYLVGSDLPTLVFDTYVAAPHFFDVAQDNQINATEAAGAVVVRGGGDPFASIVLTYTGTGGSFGPRTVTVNANGIWEDVLLPSQITTLRNGPVQVSAYQRDLAGNVSLATQKSITIDTLVAAPTLDTVAGNGVVNASEKALGVDLSGHAEAGAWITVNLSRNGVSLIKTAQADGSGDWLLTLPTSDLDALGDGAVQVVVQQRDAAGNTVTGAPQSFTISAAALSTPVVVQALTGDDMISVAEQSTGVQVSGTGPAQTQLTLRFESARGELLRTVNIDSNGQWQVALSTDELELTLGSGDVTLQAYAVNDEQQSTALTTHSFRIERAEPSPSVARVGTDGYVNLQESQAPVQVAGGGEAGHIVEVTLHGQSGAVLTRTVSIDSDRKWSVALTPGEIATLGDGEVAITAIQKASSAPGAATSLTTTSQFVIDTVAPLSPHASDISTANAYNTVQSDMAGGVTVLEATDNGVFVAIPLPADALVGNKLVLLWGDQEITRVMTEADVPLGGVRVLNLQVPTGVIVAAGSGIYDVSVIYYDAAGNASATQILYSQLNVAAPPAPPQFDTVYVDNAINAAEAAHIAVNGGTIRGTVLGAGTITLELTGANGVTRVYSNVPVNGGSWAANISDADLQMLGEGRVDVTAVFNSIVGVQSAPGRTFFSVDTQVPQVPSDERLLLAAEENARGALAGGLIRSSGDPSEAASNVTVHVAIGADTFNGDRLTLYWGVQQINAIVQQIDIDRGYAQVSVSRRVMSVEGDSDNLIVEAQVTDRAGNTGPRYAVWNGLVDAVPLAPDISIVENNGYLNFNRATAGWQVTGEGIPGNSVVITLVGTALDANFQPVQWTSSALVVGFNGTWSVTLTMAQAQALGNGTVQISAVQSDATGNVSDPSVRNFTIDLLPPAAPTMDSVTADNRVSFSEGQSNVTLSGTGEVGAAISIRLTHEGREVSKTTQVGSNGAWSTVMTPAELALLGGGSVPIQAQVQQTDVAGNASTATLHEFRYTTDAVALPTVSSVTGIAVGSDLFFNVADLNALDNVTAPFTISGVGDGSKAGNQVRLNLKNADGVNFTFVIDVPVGSGAWSKTLTLSELTALGQGAIAVSAVQISPELDESLTANFITGNNDNTFTIDTVVPALTGVTVMADGLNGNAKAGDLLIVTVQASEVLQLMNLDTLNTPTLTLDLGAGQTRIARYDALLSASAGAQKMVFTYEVVNGDAATTVSLANTTINLNGATLVDVAGNVASNSVSNASPAAVVVDTVAPTVPTILGVDEAGVSTPGGSTINRSEVIGGMEIRVNLAGTGATVNDTLQLFWKVGADTITVSKVLLSSEISSGVAIVTLDLNVVGNLEGSATLTARLRDAAGNSSVDSSPFVVTVDTINPAAPQISTWMGDNKINQTEWANNLVSALTGNLIESGARVTATLIQGSVSLTLTTTLNGSGGWSVSQAQMLSALNNIQDGTFVVNVTQIDAADNASTTTVGRYFMDRTRPNAPTIEAMPLASDGWINLRDVQTTGVQVRVSLADTHAAAGDELVLSGFKQDTRYVLTAADIAANQVLLSIPAVNALQTAGDLPRVGAQIQARIEDQGGNVSPLSNSFVVNIDTIVLAPAVDITRGAAAGVSSMQSTAPMDFFGTGAEPGADIAVILTGVTGNAFLLPTTAAADGTFKVTLSPTDMKDLGDGPVSYQVTQTDAALNQSTAAVGGFDLHLSVPQPTLFLMTQDNVVSSIEAATASTVYSGLGQAGNTIQIEFYVKGSNGVFESTPRLVKSSIVVAADGTWSTTLSNANFSAISPTGQGMVQIKATQTASDNTVSSAAVQEFYIDRLAPTLAQVNALRLFDGNNDGSNKDGLLITFSEPVAVNEMRKLSTSFSLGANKSFGSDARVEAVNSVSINGQYYATEFKIFLDNDTTLTTGDMITIKRGSIVDAGGNPAIADQVLTLPSMAAPGLPTPPIDVMGDNRLNSQEQAGVTRLSFQNVQTGEQLNAALGGLLEIKVNGEVIDRVIPKVTTIALDLTFSQPVKLNQNVIAQAQVRVRYMDGSSQVLTLSNTGDASSATTASAAQRFTVQLPADVANVQSLTYIGMSYMNAYWHPTAAFSSSNSAGKSNFSMTLTFPNEVHLAAGQVATALVRTVFTDTNTWEYVTLSSVPGTATTAAGVTTMTYTATVNRPHNPGHTHFEYSAFNTNLTFDPDVSVVTSGANAPKITAIYDMSVVVPTTSLHGGDVVTTTLLTSTGAVVAGSEQTPSYSALNPSRIEFTQSLADALSAAGRKISLFVDGVQVSTPVNMGITSLYLYVYTNWEGQTGGSSGSGAAESLQADATMTARVRVTFKAGTGLAAREIELTAVGGSTLSQRPYVFGGDFPPDIDLTKVQTIAYVSGSLSQLDAQHSYGSSVITTSQLIEVPASAWDGISDGLKQLTAQTTTADGALTSIFSAPKQIRVDSQVDGIQDIRLLTDANPTGSLGVGDVLQFRFKESVQFTFSALPAEFGSNPTVTPIASENGYSTLWQVTLGVGATIGAGQSFNFVQGKVFDLAGNSNSATAPLTATVPSDVMTALATPTIDNVSVDNVITTNGEATAVKILLSKAKAGDIVKLMLDGVEVATGTVAADNQANISFNVTGSAWGADGERQLLSTVTRGSSTVSSNTRSVYVAADQSHWSQEQAYAGKIYWFDPDTLTQSDGGTVTTWTASAGGISVANTVANTKTFKMTDPYTGHSYLVTDANSRFLETKVGAGYLYQAPTLSRYLGDATMPTAGYTDFMMFKPINDVGQYVLMHPVYRYTSNATPVTYTNSGTTVTVNPYTQLLKGVTYNYNFTELVSNWNISSLESNGRAFGSSMTNVLSLGAWQLATFAVQGYSASIYNQMRFNQSLTASDFIPTATNPMSINDYLVWQAIDSDRRRLRIGGNGAGVLADQISITVATNWAYQQEVGSYLAAKYQSSGAVALRNADLQNTTYNLASSNLPNEIIDQILRLNDIVSDDTITIAGADYVTSGSGNDRIIIQDLAFRLLDGGLGTDTLVLSNNYADRADIFLSDFISNARGLTGSTEANRRVNDAGYHRLLGFEKFDFVQDGGTGAMRQIITVDAADVKQISETNNVEMVLGRQDVLKVTGFGASGSAEGVFSFNNAWYDHRYTVTEGSSTYNLYTRGGDRPAEAVGFKNIAAISQLQLNFDHAMIGNVIAGDFSITTYTGASVYATAAVSIDLRQGVALSLSSPLSTIAKLTYTGGLVDEAGRGFHHNTWVLGTDGSDTLSGAILTASEKASGVTFLGGAGADQITGTQGADLIIGGLGADILTGGSGSDTFAYRNELSGSGGSGGLGGTSGDIITDFKFNAANPADNDRVDLSLLFESNFQATGNATTDAQALASGGFIELIRKLNTQTFKEDLQIWVDRDGGGAMGLLATLADGATNLPGNYPVVEPSQQLLERLINEGRLVVSHF